MLFSFMPCADTKFGFCPQATVEWFRVYKMPTGKPPNKFAFEGEAKNRAFAMNIVQETHAQWQNLVHKKCDPGGMSW